MIVLIGDSGRRTIGASEIPLAVGLSAAGEVFYGASAEHAPVAWLRSHDNRIYIQPESMSYRVTHNDAPIMTSAWLADGDRIGLGRALVHIGADGGMLTLSATAHERPVIPAPALPPPDAATGTAGATEETLERAAVAPRPVLKPRRRARKLMLALFAALTLGAGFVIAASAVRIEVTPEPERLSFTGPVPPIAFGERYLAVPGQYSVIAARRGYHKLEETVRIGFASKSDLAFTMRKLPGRLTVTTTPVAGAEIAVDGRPVGRSPLAELEIEAGNHVLRATADRYVPAESPVDILGMGEAQAIELKLRPGWGALSVSSDPERATVKLDGREIGETPLLHEPMAGSYSLLLSKDGWKPIRTPVTIEAQQRLSLPLFKMERIEGTLSVSTNPVGATVAVDGSFLGRSPVSLALVSGKSYRVTLTKPGYVIHTQSVGINGGSTATIDVRLKPEYGVVFVKTSPPGATLSVDGKRVGSASRRLQLTTESHRIEIAKEGYVPFSTTVTPRKGISKTVDVQLKSNAEALQEMAAKGIVTKAGPVVRLIPIIKPVQFTVGASRREAGRRANESQYTVALTRSFVIGEKEITNDEFRRFRPAHNSGAEQGSDLNGGTQPVALVSWDDAARYLNWLSEKEGLQPAYREENGKMVPVSPMTKGFRLPTEAEWTFVARLEGGRRPAGSPLKYSWGEAMPPGPKSGNFADASASGHLPNVLRDYSDGFSVSAPVGSFTPNKATVYDLAGNVAEWCHDFYDTFIGVTQQVLRDPMGPPTGEFHVVRGSSWRHGTITELRLSYRDYAKSARNDLGFRIARYVDLPK